MSDLVLLDFANFSFDRFAKVQRILKPDKTVPVLTHFKPDATDRYEFAKKVVNATLTLLDSWKKLPGGKLPSESNKRYIGELASLAFSVLYERPVVANTEYIIEKRHVSFILKLADVKLLEQAFIELNHLAASLFNQIFEFNELDFFEYSAASLLSIPIPRTSPSEATINIVLLSQISLLKTLSTFLIKQPRPVANSIVLDAFGSTAGPRAWCALLAQPTRDQKLTLFSKLLFALSNNASLKPSFQYRILALRLIPKIEDNYINLTLGTFESLRNISKMTTRDIVSEFGSKILKLSTERLSQLRKSDNYVLFFEICFNAAKQVSINYLDKL
jgi:hypothetical protein